MGHLGPRVSALLDGQLDAAEAERAWAHVHACHLCRDEVEREGWVKTRLAGLGMGEPATPMGLKGSLMDRLGDCHREPADASAGAQPSPHEWATWPAPPGDVFLQLSHGPRPRRAIGIAAIGGGAVGAAMMGVLALGAAPADAPTVDRRAPLPAASINQPGPGQLLTPQRRATYP